MHKSDLLVYKASAGSGKTYTIVKTFFEFLAKYPGSFKNILAITFTNSVALEMQTRILEKASELSKTDKFFHKLLGFMLKNYEDFSVQTIDSFIQNTLSKILSIKKPYSTYKITLNLNSIFKKIIKKFLSENQNEYILDNIILFIEKMFLEGKSWNLEKNLLPIITALILESTKKKDAEIIESLLVINQKKKNILKRKKKIADLVIKVSNEIINEIKNADLQIEDFAYGHSGAVGYIHKLSLGKISEPGIRFKEALQGGNFWFSKASKKENYFNLVEEKLIPLAINIFSSFEKDFTFYNSALISEKNIFLLEILVEVNSFLKKYLRENKILFLSENSNLLNSLLDKRDEIYKKIGLEFSKIFIDEFQDVSESQWSCFKSILKSYTKKYPIDVCIVGDPKQSIYRWRGSTSSIMESNSFSIFDKVEVRNLDTNWRSFPNITKFNNYFISNAQKIISDELNSSIEEHNNISEKLFLRGSIKKIEETYKDIYQKAKAKSENFGYVEIKFKSYKDEGKSSQEKKKEIIGDSIDIYESLQKDGFLPKNIAFIVRSNSEAAEVFSAVKNRESSSFKKKYCEYDIVSKVSLNIKKNKTIKFLINILEYYSGNKSDSCFFEMLVFFENSYDKNKSFQLKEKLKILEKNIFTNEIALLDKVIELFNLKSPSVIVFLEKFFEVFREKIIEGETLENFLEWWKNDSEDIFLNLDNDSSSKILTIHQAKGLQFDAVIIPNFDWDLDHSSNKSPIIWSKNCSYEDLNNLPINYSKKLAKSYFAVDYFQEKINSYLDNLNLMYVSLTRAKERMYILVPKENKEKIESVRDIMYKIFESEEIKKSDFSHFEKIDEKIIIGEKKSKNAIKDKTKNKFFHFENIPISEKKVFENINLLKIKASKLGLKKHKIFEKISLIEEVRNFNNKNYKISTERLKLINIVDKKFSKDFLKEIKSNYTEKVEQAILLKDGSIIRIDRLIITSSKVFIFDLKSGIVKNHEKQISDYKSSLKILHPEKEVDFKILVG